MNGVLAAAEATGRAHRRPAARTPDTINGDPKTAGRGAGRLAATDAQEVYHQYLLGPSVRQVLVGGTGQLIWVEGSGDPRVESDEHEVRAEARVNCSGSLGGLKNGNGYC
jgi:hypothetical protein